jgi:hypothetical protein
MPEYHEAGTAIAKIEETTIERRVVVVRMTKTVAE